MGGWPDIIGWGTRDIEAQDFDFVIKIQRVFVVFLTCARYDRENKTVENVFDCGKWKKKKVVISSIKVWIIALTA